MKTVIKLKKLLTISQVLIYYRSMVMSSIYGPWEMMWKMCIIRKLIVQSLFIHTYIVSLKHELCGKLVKIVKWVWKEMRCD